MKETIDIENRHTSGVYAKNGVCIVRGQGALLWDSLGKEYIDCAAGHGVAILGHAHPEVVRAIAEQAGILVTCQEAFYNDRRAELLSALGNLVPGLERVYLCNSGTEAVEASIKFSRLSTGRTQIVAAMRGFHGRTMGSLSATWNKKYREPFEPLVPGFCHVPFNNLQALADAMSEETAAVLLEVVQGEGGVHPAEEDYLLLARKLCTKYGAHLIVDEIQTGFGRTGEMFAINHYGVIPDMVCLAKAIAGGLPMGAVLVSKSVNNLSPGMHGSTFGGNPLVCAAALAVLRVIEQDQLCSQSAEKGRYLLSSLREIKSPVIREVRGMGLMVGIEIKQKVAPYLGALQEAGVLALPAGLNVIRLLPPLVIAYDQLDAVIDKIQAVLE
jgi:LysW-gamma-L-lysine/LysW-L-ornithine aminotransferase